MPQIINTNIASLTAQRNLNSSQSANSTALERLSSGLRINSAKDDAAGLAISTKFESQVKGLNVAIRNAGDGISLAQTAEGALGAMTENLQRIRELAVQSSNATNSDDDRVALQAEVKQLLAEVSRTAEETNFNGRNLLDGSFEGTFQIGANAGNTVNVKIAELTAEKLGVGQATGVSAIGTDEAIQNGDLTINGVAIDPSRANSDTSSIVNAGASAIAKVATINEKSAATGVTAEVNTNVAAGAEMTAAQTSGTIAVNGVDISVSTGGVSLQADRESVISSINAKSDQTGVIAKDGGDTGGVILEAADGRNITVEFKAFGGDTGDDAKISAATGLNGGSGAANSVSGNDERVTSYGGYTLVSQDGSDITLEGGVGTGTGNIANAGLTSGVYSGREAAVTSLSRSAGVQTVETAGTFTTASFGLTSVADGGTAQQINATNNSFELNVNGAGFQTVTLDGTYDVDGTGGLTAGQYDSAATLAAQINYAISDVNSATYAANANLRDADGNALVTANANDDGSITFTSATEGLGSSVVARTGEGTFDIPQSTTEVVGVAGGDLDGEALEINFAGENTITITGGTNNQLNINDGVIAAADITIANGTYTGEQFVEQLNTQLAAGSFAAEAVLSEDGSTVSIQSTNVGGAVAVAAGTSALQTNATAQNTVKLANGDTVISGVNALFDLVTGANETLSLSVDGAAGQDLELGSSITAAYEAFTGVGGSYAADLALAQDAAASGNAAQQAEDAATFLNNILAIQVAGSGVTATAVGDQVVLSSISGGSVDVAIGGANPIAAAASVAGGGNATISTVSASSGTVTTGNFARVSDGTDGLAEGTFISTDFDGAGSEFETKASPLVIEAGVNDTFNIAVDGGAEQTVTIAAGTYNTMDELASAITATAATTAATLEGVDISGLAKGDFDFLNDGNLAFDMSLNGGTSQTITIATDIDTATTTVAQARDELVTQLQSALDSTFGSDRVSVGYNSTSGKLEFSAVNGESLEIDSVGGNAGAANSDFVALDSTTPEYSAAASDDKQALVFTSGTTGASSSVEVSNGTFAITGGASDGEQLTSEIAVNALESGDLVINGTAIGAASALSDTASDTTAETSNAAASGIATAAAINASTKQTGVTATVNATSLNGGTSTTAATGTAVNSIGSVWINNVETGTIQLTGDADRDRAAAIDTINAVSGQTGVMAEDNGESITLTAADGRNISVAIDNKLAENSTAGRNSADFGSYIGLSSSQVGIGEADFGGTAANFANTAKTTYSTVTLTSAGTIDIQNGVNGTDEVEALGLKLGTYGGSEDGTFLKDLDISTFEGAQAAITAIDNALQTVSSQRAELGALQNRFESTSSNLQITSENLAAANSRIRDADFAAETAELSRTQVLQQAGISILAQANQRPQQVLSLLG